MAKFELKKDEMALVFLGSRQITSQKGNTVTFVSLGDPQAYLNHDFMVDPQKINLNLPIHATVRPTFDLGSYNGRPSFNLVGLEVVQEATAK